MPCKCTIVVTALVLFAAVWFYQSLPSNLGDSRVAVQLVLGAIPPASSVLGLLGELSGIKAVSAINVTRGLLSTIVYATHDISSLGVKVEDVMFDGVPTRLYVPNNAKANGPAAFQIHGGGWLFLTPSAYDAINAHFAHSFGMVVAGVDYRRAPEHKYPTALDDSEKSFRYFVNHASQWNIDPKKIGLIGDSCGGNLAAALAIRLRDSGNQAKQTPYFQLLIYPMLQIHNFTTVSYRLNVDDLVFSRDSAVVSTASYAFGMDLPQSLKQAGFSNLFDVAKALAGNRHSRNDATRAKIRRVLPDDLYDAVRMQDDQDSLSKLQPQDAAPTDADSREDKALSEAMEPFILDPQFSPLVAPSLSALPPTFIALVNQDILRDDGLLYAERLKRAGVKVATKMYYENHYHAFSVFEPARLIPDIRKFFEDQHLL